jgi:hypothetical protein
MSRKTSKPVQLEIPQAIALPQGHYLRTLVDEQIGIFCEFDLSKTYKHGMTSHTLYRPDGIWLGDIFRDFADEPWQIAATGQDKVRGAWRDFADAVAQLLRWRHEIDLEMVEWRKVHDKLSQSSLIRKPH